MTCRDLEAHEQVLPFLGCRATASRTGSCRLDPACFVAYVRKTDIAALQSLKGYGTALPSTGHKKEAFGPMFSNWRRQRRRNREIVEDLYGALIARARRPYLFEECGIEDTVMGRFEAVTLEIYLFMRRCRGDSELAPIVQDIVDRFVVDMDDSLRQIGIGDQSVPKRMRKLTGQFYERVNAYDQALDSATPTEALADAFRGRIIPAETDESVASKLAGEAQAELAALDTCPARDFLSGHIFKSGTP